MTPPALTIKQALADIERRKTDIPPPDSRVLSRAFYKDEHNNDVQALKEFVTGLLLAGQFTHDAITLVGNKRMVRVYGRDGKKRHRPSGKVPFVRAIRSAGLLSEFKSVAHPEARMEEIIAWVASKPALANAKVPATFRYIRRNLECRGKHGGPRGNQFAPRKERAA